MITLVVFALLYASFLYWYGGRGKPLAPAEVEQFAKALAACATPERRANTAREVHDFARGDDGREFYMMNLARYRQAAAYPHGQGHTTDARAADRRYGRLIFPKLLRRASIICFVGPRVASLIDYAGAPRWDYIALVRYRSRRDFLDFALEIESQGISMHKWAALEETHVFPVRPFINAIWVRSLVGGAFLLAAMLCAPTFG